jgi:hypothetical protein
LTSTLLVALVVGGAWLVLRPGGPPLVTAALSHDTISPNADGQVDATQITYRLRRPAAVSIYFTDESGARYYFRQDKEREAGEHRVDFSGIVKPYTLPNEAFESELEARVLRDGAYTWTIEASDGQRGPQAITGTLTIEAADTALPLLRNLTVSPPVFTPNQDGLDDRARINVWLDKDIAEGGLRLYLVDPAGTALPMAEDPAAILPGRRGVHTYDYDAGIDLGLEPPADGTYLIRAVAEDRLGQRVTLTSTLAIAMGGLPRADILLGEVAWSATSVVLGDTLYFTLTVENYGTAPIRTTGPASGYVYQSMGENANTLGEFVQAGAWRVAINCETCESDYPWRWALGTPADLTPLTDRAGRTQYYLLPDQRVTVTGGIVLDRVVRSRNPQYFWAGLIHEDVAIATINNRVDPAFVTIVGAEE